MSFLFVDEDMSSNDMEELKDYFDEFMSSLKDECKKLDDKDEKYLCKEAVNSFLGIEGSNGKDLSTKISKIKKETDILFYAGTSIDQTIDFSKLKSQMCVIMIRPKAYSTSIAKIDNYKNQIKRIYKKISKLSFDGSDEKIIKLASSFESKKNKKPKSKTYATIYGNIKDKVSFLTISDYSIEITGSDLNCHSLYLYDCEIDSSPKKIATKFLYTDDESHETIFKDAYKKYFGSIEQYCLVLYSYDKQNYKITYKTYSWSLYFSKYGYTYYYIPYNFAKSFGIYVLSNYIVIGLEDEEAKSYPQFNITVAYSIPTVELPDLTEDKETVRIVTEGNWDTIKNKPKIIVTTEKENFNVKKGDNCDLDFSVQELYTYSAKKNGPNVGMIVGIVVACVVVIAVVVIIVVFLYIRKKKSQEMSENEGNAQEVSK